jgi:FAD/FMN-containing dehydrogenase
MLFVQTSQASTTMSAAATLDGTQIVLPESEIEDLRARMRGRVVLPEEDDYDTARKIWNAMIDCRPAMIIECAGTADVMHAVRFGRKHNLLTSVRGGGHNVAGNSLCDAGMVIDLGGLNSVRVDPIAKVARVGGGCRLGQVDQETEPFGLVVPSGIVTDTGVGGLTTGGGMGWLHRKWGLTCDNLLSADVVTANGELVVASAASNPDLFWGIRGGGGNFGIVTSFEFRCRDFGPTALAGLVVHPFDAAPDLFRFFRAFTASAPDEVSSIAILRLAPPAPFLPEEIHGKPVAIYASCYAGDPEEGEAAVAPIKEFGNPIADVLVPKPFLKHQSMLDAGQPAGGRYYWKSHYFDELTDDMLDATVARGAAIRSPMSIFALVHMGGAVSRVGEDETAYPNRKSPYVMNVNASWMDRAEDEIHRGWARETWETLDPFSTGGRYVNFEAEDGVEAIYGSEKYRRLAEVKATYDPDNFFRMNQNVKPA